MISKHPIYLCIFAIALNAYCDLDNPTEAELASLMENDEDTPSSASYDLDLTMPPEGPVAATPLTGVVSDGGFITVPSGTVGKWSLLVSPNLMGTEEVGSEKDNALLKLDCHASVINDFTWKVTASYKYRFWSTKDGIWKPGKANYILVPR
jgi:hypothetical protein